ncbi:hypothetical protein [Streptacidiphilus melanogenes]|uniref:hypothetical protein n=1 Tax=Streptacidiphilus melanogenes TaxID=411235 RepID=UPI0005A62A91|nr:hypothetical protein [Streptacidiphilus melanogenes]
MEQERLAYVARELARLKDRPGLLGLDGSYRDYVMLIQGMNLATRFELLRGFSEELVGALGTGGNLPWPVLIWRLAYPDRPASESLGLDDPQGRARELLFERLLAFLGRAADGDG